MDIGTSDSTPTGIGSLTVDCPSPIEAAGHDKLSSLLNGSLSSAWTSKYEPISLKQHTVRKDSSFGKTLVYLGWPL